jgi:hypothetical protein
MSKVWCLRAKKSSELTCRRVFDSLDRDGDGKLSYIETEFGLKTVNKQLITRQELNYVSVILEVQKSAAIDFR